MHKIQLYNLINYGVPKIKIESIIESWKNDIFSFPALESFLGEDNYNKILFDRELIESEYGIHVLYYLDIPEFLLEKFFNQYTYLSELLKDIEEERIDVTDNVKTKIMDLVKIISANELKINWSNENNDNNKKVSETEAVTMIIRDNILTNTREIISNLSRIGVHITTNQLSFVLNTLRQEGKLKYVDGRYVVHDPKSSENKKSIDFDFCIEEYIEKISEDKKMYFDYILSLEKKKFLSKYRLDQDSFEVIAKDYIKNLKFFNYEKRLYYFLSTYDIPHRVLEKKYTPLLYNYVKFKYSVKPEKTFYDFLENEDEYDVKEANLLLAMKGKYSLDGKINDISFSNLIIDFYEKTNKEIITKNNYEEFFYFCKRIIPNKLSFIPKNDESFFKSVGSVENFYKKSNGYFYFNSSKICDSTIKIVREMISDIRYPHSYETLFNKNKELLAENNIFNRFSFESIIKSSNFNEIKCFEDYCSPTYSVVEDFIVDTILEYDLKSQSDLKIVLKTKYCFIDSFYDSSVTEIINKFFHDNQILEFTEINEDDFMRISNYLKHGFCTLNGLESLYKKNELQCKQTELVHPHNLRKLDLKKDGKYFFNKKYSCFDEAFVNFIENSERIIYIGELVKLLGEEDYLSIYEKYKEKKYIIKYTENTLFNLINPNNLIIQRKLYDLRDRIVDGMDPFVIYNYDELLDISKLSKIAGDIVYEFFDRKQSLISLLSTHKEVTIKETTRFLFRKKGKISKEEAIKIIMNGKDYINYSELVQTLESDYGYISTMDLENLFSKLNLVHKKLFDMVFKNIDVYYKKVEEISNGY